MRLTSFVEILSGASLGLLVGLLLGLSSAGVVGGVVASLAALLAAFLGLGPSAKKAEKDPPAGLRVVGFGICCAAALVVGVLTRTHNWLGTQPVEQVASWRAAGYAPREALDLVAFGQYGIVPSGHSVLAPPKPSTASGLLFSSAAQDCDALAGERFATPQLRLAAFENAGKAWKNLAVAARGAPDADLPKILDAAYALVCEKAAAA